MTTPGGNDLKQDKKDIPARQNGTLINNRTKPWTSELGSGAFRPHSAVLSLMLVFRPGQAQHKQIRMTGETHFPNINTIIPVSEALILTIH